MCTQITYQSNEFKNSNAKLNASFLCGQNATNTMLRTSFLVFQWVASNFNISDTQDFKNFQNFARYIHWTFELFELWWIEALHTYIYVNVITYATFIFKFLSVHHSILVKIFNLTLWSTEIEWNNKKCAVTCFFALTSLPFIYDIKKVAW